jgi:hypothetical protein
MSNGPRDTDIVVGSKTIIPTVSYTQIGWLKLIWQALTNSAVISSAGNDSVQTSATGATFVALADHPCHQVDFVNNSGTDLEIQQDGTGSAITVFDGTYFTMYGISNTNQLAVRRVDQSNTQVSMSYRWGL